MFDVLVYLFENYYQNDAHLDQDALARKLTAAGFENEDISDALSWLKTLAMREPSNFPEHFDESRSFRAYSFEECAKIPAEGRGFLAFLESARVLTPSLREVIVERAMAVAEEAISLEKVKVIVLMVLWTRRGDVDTLVLEELLPEGGPRAVH